MKNKLGDLNNHLFAALERLNDESLSGENLAAEAARAKAIAGLAGEVLRTGQLALDAARFAHEAGGGQVDLPAMLKHRPDP